MILVRLEHGVIAAVSTLLSNYGRILTYPSAKMAVLPNFTWLVGECHRGMYVNAVNVSPG